MKSKSIVPTKKSWSKAVKKSAKLAKKIDQIEKERERHGTDNIVYQALNFYRTYLYLKSNRIFKTISPKCRVQFQDDVEETNVPDYIQKLKHLRRLKKDKL